MSEGSRTVHRSTLNALLLLGVVLVLVSHSYPLTGHDKPLADLGESPGEVARALLFTVAGFLNAASWTRHPRVRSYLGKRVVRIVPGLLAVLLVTTLLVGPIVTTLTPAAYFSSLDTWGYLGRNAALYTPHGVLPGVFANNPYPDAVNGALWTLPVQAVLYCCLAVAGTLGMLNGRRRWLLVVALAGLLVAEMVLPQATMVRIAVKASACFVLGMLLYLWRDRVPVSLPLAVVLVGAWGLSLGTRLLYPVESLAIAYVVFLTITHVQVPRARLRHVDGLHFGVWTWGFLVQQLIVAAWPRALGPGGLVLISLPLTVIVAWCSYRCVERPAMRLRRLVTGPDADPMVPPTDIRQRAPGYAMTDPAPPADPELEQPAA